MNIATYLHGIYPRSEALVSATRDLDRGRTTPEAVDELYDQDLKELIRAQGEAGVDAFTDGLLRWQDLFRPIVEASPGLKPGALVRWFDTNTFYRQPEVDGELSLGRVGLSIMESSVAVPGPRVATLPSPLVFSRVALSKSEPNDVMQDFAAGILKPLTRWLASSGYGIIHLQEPWVASHGIEDDDWKLFAESIEVATEGVEATTVLHTYYGDASPWIDRLRELPVDAVGIDFIHTDLDALGTDWPTGLVVGCLDGRNSLVEPVEHVTDFVKRVADRLGPPSISLSVSSDLELLPQTIARRKLLAMGEAGRRLKEML